MAPLRMSHIGICVSDLERSLRFYRDVLGFRPRNELAVRGEPADTLLRLKDVDLRARYLEREGVCIELLHYASPGHAGDGAPRAMNALGLTHLSLRVDDLEGFLPRLAEAGATVLSETRIDIPQARTRAIFVADPDGTLIELVEQPGD
jgi:catechol 2,3-dioxygenase-like lactoylglutathione lyase family enzyme